MFFTCSKYNDNIQRFYAVFHSKKNSKTILAHVHHVVQSFVQLFGNVSVVQFFVHEGLQKTVDGCFQLL